VPFLFRLSFLQVCVIRKRRKKSQRIRFVLKKATGKRGANQGKRSFIGLAHPLSKTKQGGGGKKEGGRGETRKDG